MVRVAFLLGWTVGYWQNENENENENDNEEEAKKRRSY
jgi:hypothetical protein